MQQGHYILLWRVCITDNVIYMYFKPLYQMQGYVATDAKNEGDTEDWKW